ncbi:hypothetical protein [Streptomyces sp. NPDC018031]|uniref:hypothetical protein n=1 Tax=Streptomyces sp. NPDC018031 TaxID=3365033 RepID=UPI00379DD97C
MKPVIFRVLGAVALGAAVLGVGAGSAAAADPAADSAAVQPVPGQPSDLMDTVHAAMGQWLQQDTTETDGGRQARPATGHPGAPGAAAPHILPAPGSLATGESRS